MWQEVGSSKQTSAASQCCSEIHSAIHGVCVIRHAARTKYRTSTVQKHVVARDRPGRPKMAEERELSSKWKFYNVIILGFGFFLLFTAFQTTANVQVRLRTIAKTVCEIALRLSSITERMSFLLVQTTTISVFFSEKCNSVS